MANTVIFVDNSGEVLDSLGQAVKKALSDIGMACESYTKDGTPVRTGTLRDSFGHIVEGNAAIIGSDSSKFPQGRSYAKYVEFGTSKQKARHMLGNAVRQNIAKYKKIAERALKG